MHRCALLLGFALALFTAPAGAQSCDGFTDVAASSPFCPDVTFIANYNITKGCAPSLYCPNETVTRLQMAAFLHRLGGMSFFQNGNVFGGPAVLGTLDNNPLTFIVLAQQAMMVQPAVDTAYGFNPNIVNGMSVNAVAGGAVGATIAGGGGCNPGSGGTCVSGYGNQVTAGWGTVGGGFHNSADNYATVAGGIDNIASTTASTVAGGETNTASGVYSTVAGGSTGTASGGHSTVAGGFANTASGNYSFAAGNKANADQDQCFVFANWSFLPGSDFSCLGVTNIAKFGLDHGLSVDYGAALVGGGGSRYVAIGDTSSGNTINAWSGAVLTDGGTWTNASDRGLKTDFTAVDAQAVLEKVAQLPIDEWRYKTESGQRHLGPVAQDFYAAFGLGADDRHITTVDEGGVALAAIKGLNAKMEKALDEKSRQLEKQSVTIREQQREIAELSERVQKAEALAADVVALKTALSEMQRGLRTVAMK